ncbi:hypothetical protein C1H46_027166 [Malus baccata]|uniref:Uncharacterized protein n=1 Tax=Malus baccata TaxID=106549 RepID=A0A540LLA8_MALBA|nr:hypothetical protein C1H46_027166 [Malus baccata]
MASFYPEEYLYEEIHRSRAQGARGSREGRVVLARGGGQQIPRGQETRGRSREAGRGCHAEG